MLNPTTRFRRLFNPAVADTFYIQVVGAAVI